MNTQNLYINSKESQKVNRKHPFNSRTIIAATCLFFGSMNVAMADACSSKQIKNGCSTKTSTSGYEWCDCPAQSYQKGGSSDSQRERTPPGVRLRDNPKIVTPK